MDSLADFKEIVEVIKDNGGETFKRCYQCGLCDAVCPWNRVLDFSMRKLVREASFGLTDIESEDIWRCTTCGSCPQECPRDVRQIDSGVALRRLATEYSIFPASVDPIRGITASLMGQGNPLNEDRADRTSWTEGLPVPKFQEGMEYLYFPGCYLSYDPRLKKVGRATAALLGAAGVVFGILGEKESCCGESIRKAGDEEVFRKLAKANISAFIEAGVKRILVSSPHCYHTFRNEYPEFMVNFEVIHVTQLLVELIRSGWMRPKRAFPKKIAYHDPCYLGRHNGIYYEPRAILGAIPGVQLIELPDALERSLCCGGGGGRIWMETPKGERFSDLRIEQALAAGAEMLVTSCPYCIANFEDSRITMGEYQGTPVEELIEIRDITEVLRESV